MLYLLRPSALFSRQRVTLDVPVVVSFDDKRFAAQTVDLSVTGVGLALDPMIVAQLAIGRQVLLDVPVQRVALSMVSVQVRSLRPEGIDLAFAGLSRKDCIAVQQLMTRGRRLRRTEVRWPVRLVGEGNQLSTVTLDATENGLCVEGGIGTFSPGERLRVQMHLPDGGQVDAMAEVTWGPRQVGLPLRLYGIEALGRERLRACLAGAQDVTSDQAAPRGSVAIASPPGLTSSRFE